MFTMNGTLEIPRAIIDFYIADNEKLLTDFIVSVAWHLLKIQLDKFL